MSRLRREYDTIDRELRALRETFNSRQDTWIKEKLSLEVQLPTSTPLQSILYKTGLFYTELVSIVFISLQQKLKEHESNAKKLLSIPGDRETTKMKNLIKQLQDDLETKTREISECQDKVLQMQKDVSIEPINVILSTDAAWGFFLIEVYFTDISE
jgi:hypothetical protein